jgi:hypothetical protein
LLLLIADCRRSDRMQAEHFWNIDFRFSTNLIENLLVRNKPCIVAP